MSGEGDALPPGLVLVILAARVAELESADPCWPAVSAPSIEGRARD